MLVIYFHGFASNPNGSKVDMLREAGFTVFAPEIDIDPDVAEPRLISFIRGVIGAAAIGEQIVFVGTSLGGFWAARMGELFDGEAVLINPAMRPEESLKKYLGPYTNYFTGEQKMLTAETVAKYARYPSAGSDRHRTYFIARHDAKLVSVPTGEARVFTYESDDHRGMSFFGDVIKYLKTK